ncbi:MAG TPA: hypothetical protein VJQ43_01550 [Thermoplasmata archaeon]|nr:hypothetical protein [Thermoplasmata archaeon]
MSPAESPLVNPYATTPGSSTPGVGVSAEEGTSDLWSFFWLSVACTAILTVVGVLGWLLFRG